MTVSIRGTLLCVSEVLLVKSVYIEVTVFVRWKRWMTDCFFFFLYEFQRKDILLLEEKNKANVLFCLF